MLFQLTDEHLRTGTLTEDDYSKVAGFKVHVLEMDDFPHAQELKETHRLDEDKKYARAEAIYSRFCDLGIVKSLSEKMLKVIDSQIENISSQDQIIKVSNKNLFYLHRDIMKGVELAGSNWRLQKSYKLKGGF